MASDHDYRDFSRARGEVSGAFRARKSQPSKIGEEDDLSCIDENYDVASLASSIEDQLTYGSQLVSL